MGIYDFAVCCKECGLFVAKKCVGNTRRSWGCGKDRHSFLNETRDGCEILCCGGCAKGGGEAKNVAETTSIEGKSKQEEGRIDFVLDDGDTMEENTPTEVESVPEESEPVAELQAVVVDDTETEYDDATLDEEGSGAQVKGLEVEGRDGEKEVESEKLDNVAGEEIEESSRHEPIGAGTSVGSA